MLEYFETTTLILLWCGLLTCLWSQLVYGFVARGSRPRAERARTIGAILPALVVAPLALIGAFRWLGINLLFPVQANAATSTMILASFAPALVLLLASGLAGQLTRGIAAEYAHWRAKTFATVAIAVGREARTELRRLVVIKAMATAWSQCLPWLFGELVVVEAVFNAPGLGLDAWHMARIRDLSGLAQTVAWLSLMYVCCVVLTAMVHRWIGRRLESYV